MPPTPCAPAPSPSPGPSTGWDATAPAVTPAAASGSPRRLPATAWAAPGVPTEQRGCDELRVRHRRPRALPAVLRHHPRRGRARPLPGRRLAGGRPDDPRLRAGRPRRRRGVLPRRGDRGADGAGRRRADPRRRPHGGLRRHADAAARGQPGAVHSARREHPRAGGRTGHHALGSGARTVARAAGRRRGGDRQRPDRAVPPAGDDRRRGAETGSRGGLSGGVHRRLRIQAGARRRRRYPGAGVPHGARPTRRLGHHRRRRQRAREHRRMSGTLYGVGLGPGDPDLVTVRAARVIEEADVVAFHAARHGRSIARATASSYMSDGQIEELLVYPLTVEETDHPGGYEAAIEEFYAEAAERLAAHLRAGRDVALCAAGDPLFYSSFMLMYIRLADEFTCDIVPGVTAVSAVSAAVARPLVEGEEVLTVLPGTLDEATLTERLAGTDSAVVMKLGRTFDKVRRAVTAAGRLEETRYVERATWS